MKGVVTMKQSKRPRGVIVFGIVFLVIALYCLAVECTLRNLLEGRCKDCVLVVMNVIIGITILRMKPWVRLFLYTYATLMIGGIAIAYYFAFFVEESFRNIVFSPKFILESCITLIPHIIALLYLTRPKIKEEFQLWVAKS
jgi:hypothetical protein